jgi:hypothetical protein
MAVARQYKFDDFLAAIDNPVKVVRFLQSHAPRSSGDLLLTWIRLQGIKRNGYAREKKRFRGQCQA